MTPAPPPLERVAEAYPFNLQAALGLVDHATDHIALATLAELHELGECLITALTLVNAELRRRAGRGPQ